jgi:hypothetical protein
MRFGKEIASKLCVKQKAQAQGETIDPRCFSPLSINLCYVSSTNF